LIIWTFLWAGAKCSPQAIGAGQVKVAKYEGLLASGLLASVLLRVPAVKADELVMDDGKVGINVVTLTDRAETCTRPSEEHHVAKALLRKLARAESLINLTTAWMGSSERTGYLG